jgi:hypothetical protein
MFSFIALLLAVATAVPPDFSHDTNVTLLAPGGGMGETSVAVSGRRVALAVIKRTNPGAIEVFVSADGAATWSAPVAMPVTVGGITFGSAWDPALLTLDDGSFGLIYLVIPGDAETPPAHQSGTMAVVFTRSADGLTWSPPVILASGRIDPVPFADKPWIAVDRGSGTLYAFWTGHQAIMLTSSTDRGATWSTPAPIPLRSFETDAQLAVLPNRTLVLATFDSPQLTYVSRTSTDGGATFGEAKAIATVPSSSFVTPVTKTGSPPIAALVAVGNELGYVYPSQRGVFFTRSADAGATWSAPLQLGGSAGDAALPSLSFDETTGELIAAWLDGRDDPTGRTMRLYAARSRDGGAMFETPRPFSSPFNAEGALGDYDSSATVRGGLALRAFSPSGGFLAAARVELAPAASRRRAAGH